MRITQLKRQIIQTEAVGGQSVWWIVSKMECGCLAGLYSLLEKHGKGTGYLLDPGNQCETPKGFGREDNFNFSGG